MKEVAKLQIKDRIDISRRDCHDSCTKKTTTIRAIR